MREDATTRSTRTVTHYLPSTYVAAFEPAPVIKRIERLSPLRCALPLKHR